MPPPTVVLIEDNPIFLGLLTSFLEHAQPGQFSIAGSARQGAEGLELAARLRPAAVVVDLRLPSISGLDVISRLRSRDPRVAIVALTSADPDAFRDPALAAGADAFVTKGQMTTALIPALVGAVAARAKPVPSGDRVDD